jgi:pyrroline-5-carboxylate reductase
MATSSTIGFLGAGKMATALAKGFVRAEIVFPKEIIASARSAANRNCFAKEIGAKTVASNS